MADSTDPIAVLQVCGAITTWIGNNVAYCVYELDKETMLPVSRRTYYFEVDDANTTGTPDWKLLTDWTEHYGMVDLSPKSFKTMSEKLHSDEAFTTDFINRKDKVFGRHTSCDDNCRRQAYCEATYIDPYAYAQC